MLPRSAAPKPVRRRSRGTRTRGEIVAAAEGHFAERGFEAARLEDIATAVGIRRAAIFYYFGDKQELYAAVLDEVFGDWTAALPTGGSPAERLEASLIGWIDYVRRRPNVARLILREAANARPGVVSAHIFGHAVDVASVGKTTISGHQQPGSITEKAVRSILMLPVEIQPRQLISLIGMGGPSFPMADHYDHIHVGV